MEKQNINYILLAGEDKLKLKANLEKESDKGKTIIDTSKAMKSDKSEEK